MIAASGMSKPTTDGLRRRARRGSPALRMRQMSAARCVRIAATFLGRVDLVAEGADGGGSEPRGRAARITDNECARQEHPARSRAGAGNLLEQKLCGGAAELVQG